MPADVLAAIRGQDDAVQVLRRAVSSGRVAHAYAFVGPAGSGRTATALAFAKALVASDRPDWQARIDRGSFPDVRLIAPTPPKDKPKGPLALRVDDIRDLERLAALRPAEASHKVFIVDDADRMTGATPQAFLKTLEEPPAQTVIVLVLSRLTAMPATVLSRCQILRFRARGVEGVPALLPDGRGEAYAAARAALEQASAGGVEVVLRVGEALGRDRPAAEALVEACWLRYRDLLCREAGADVPLAVVDGGAPAAGPGFDALIDGLGACRDAWHALQGNVSPRLTVEVLLGRLVAAGGRS